VTASTVKIIFEVNTNLRQMVCVLKSRQEDKRNEEVTTKARLELEEKERELEKTKQKKSRLLAIKPQELPPEMVVMKEVTEEPITYPTITMEKVIRNRPIVFAFTDLLPLTEYEIYLPSLMGDIPLGRFKTLPLDPPYVEFMITSRLSVPLNQRVICELFDKIKRQQSIDLLSSMREDALLFPHLTEDDKYHPWTWLKLISNTAYPRRLTTMHLGSLSIIPQGLSEIVERLIQLTKKIELPIRDSSGVAALYFNHLEDVFKDIFRAMYSLPTVQMALASGANLPLFHSDYILPVGLIHEEQDLSYAVLRKVFEAQVDSYLKALLDIPEGAENMATLWRVGSIQVFHIDIVTDRKKLKKAKGTGEEVIEGDAAAQAAPVLSTSQSHSTSLGFIGKVPMRKIKTLLEDGTITHFVILFQKPLIPLDDIPNSYEMPNVLPKGDTFPWGPTEKDLEIFFDMFFRWIDPGDNSSRFTKYVTFVCGSQIPYSTKIQETRTGIKLHQICLGNFLPENVPVPLNVKIDGRLTGMRYRHRLNNLDEVMLDSSRANTDLAVSSNLIRPEQYQGISVLRFWQDNWKGIGRWNLIDNLPIIPVTFGNAILLAGPVIGPPLTFRTNFIYIPIMVEADRPTEITVIARNIFESSTIRITKSLRARTAEVLEVGPFIMKDFWESRYYIRIIDGLRSPIELIVSAHKSDNEFNVVVLNCDKNAKEKFPSSDFIYDVSQRSKIPFNGLGLKISLNANIQFRDIITSFVSKPDIVSTLMKNKEERELAPESRIILNDAIECMQEEIRIFFARPSHTEFLKTGFNIVLPMRGEYIQRNLELPQGMHPSEEIFWLIAERLIQEYFWQVLDPFDNVFFYEVEDGLRKSPRQSDRAEEAFMLWRQKAKPFFKPSPIGPLVAPNGVSSVEFIPELTEDTMTDIYTVVDDPSIEFGVRIVIVYPFNNYTNCGEIFYSETDENLVEFTSKLKDWIGSTFNRAISIIIPSTKYGTKTITPSFIDESMSENFCISFVDSIYKNNESKRSAKFEEGKAAIIKSRVAGGGKSKRAQEKKLEEERQQAEKLQAEVDALVAELGPDGYIIVECRVNYFIPPPPNDIKITISTVSNKVLGSVEGGSAAEQEIYKDIEAVRPSPINYIQVSLNVCKLNFCIVVL
jgi:hypothetical protein